MMATTTATFAIHQFSCCRACRTNATPRAKFALRLTTTPPPHPSCLAITRLLRTLKANTPLAYRSRFGNGGWECWLW